MDPELFVFMALSSEGTHGPGVVIVDTAQCRAEYKALAQLESTVVREQLTEQIRLHPENLYIMQKTVEHMHLLAYPRERALQKLKDGTLPTVAQ